VDRREGVAAGGRWGHLLRELQQQVDEIASIVAAG
jgi:hypothetical protein